MAVSPRQLAALLRCVRASSSVSSPSWLSAPRTVSLIGAPHAYGQPFDGVEGAPAALRGGGELSRRVAALGWRVTDRGDFGGADAARGARADAAAPDAAGSAAKHDAEVGAATRALASATEAAARAGHFVLTLGGDHSCALGSITGLLRARPRTGVLWVDAHADLNTPKGSPSGNMHGMPVALLARASAASAPLPRGLAWLAGERAALAPADLVYVGLRDLDAGEKAAIKRLGVRAFTMHDVDARGIGAVMAAALAALLPPGAPPRPLHLSFDIDACDPSVAPATGTPVPGGLSFREAHFVAEACARSGALASMDVVEVNPALAAAAGADATLRLARALVESALGKDILDDGGAPGSAE